MEQEIKYAIAVVNKPNRVSFYPESEDKIIGYIISKVIVAREETKYSNGVEYKVYDVLLPYTGLRNRREEVIYDKDGNPVNTTRIYRVYDTYEEAKAEKNELNKKVRFIVTSKELNSKYLLIFLANIIVIIELTHNVAPSNLVIILAKNRGFTITRIPNVNIINTNDK